MATQPAPAAAKPKVNTVSLKHLAATLAGDHEMPKKQAEGILGDLVNLVTKHLKKGDRVRLVGHAWRNDPLLDRSRAHS